MIRTALKSIVLLVSVGAAGCESSHYSSALRENTVQAYLRFVVAHPKGDRAKEAHRRVDRLRYRDARRADRPLGYHRYLQQHPDGAFSGAARARLAHLTLRRARTAADLALVLERFPDSKEAQAARKRLPRLLAREAVASAGPGLAARFLDQFPQSHQAPKVRAHLAALRYRTVGGQQDALEEFIQRFPGTPEASRAERRLEQLLASYVRETNDADELARFSARFPRSKVLQQLKELVAKARRDRAIIAVDLQALSGFSDKEVAQLIRWCRQAPRCSDLRRFARSASPWQPTSGIGVLRKQAYAADPVEAWGAMARLAWLSSPTAGDIILELVGSERLSTVWAASQALDRWTKNLGGARGVLQRWIDGRRARLSKDTYNPDEAQRRAYLDMLAGKSAEGLATLDRIGRAGRTLSAGYLVLRWRRKLTPNQPLPQRALVRLTAATRARVRWLRDAFPAEVHKDSQFAALLAERELFALQQALRQVVGGVRHTTGLTGLKDLSREAGGLLDSWRGRLIKGARKAYTPARWPTVARDVAMHEAGREAALGQLLRRGRVGRSVAAAVCRSTTRKLAACRSVGGKGP